MVQSGWISNGPNGERWPAFEPLRTQANIKIHQNSSKFIEYLKLRNILGSLPSLASLHITSPKKIPVPSPPPKSLPLGALVHWLSEAAARNIQTWPWWLDPDERPMIPYDTSQIDSRWFLKPYKNSNMEHHGTSWNIMERWKKWCLMSLMMPKSPWLTQAEFNLGRFSIQRPNWFYLPWKDTWRKPRKYDKHTMYRLFSPSTLSPSIPLNVLDTQSILTNYS